MSVIGIYWRERATTRIFGLRPKARHGCLVAIIMALIVTGLAGYQGERTSLPAGSREGAAKAAEMPVHYRDRVAVLAYHHIAPVENPRETATMSAENFRRHLKALQEGGFNVVSLEGVENFLAGGKIPPNTVAITFDDGYESFYTYAFPELEKRHMPASVFLILNLVGTTGRTPYLTWDEIRYLKAKGVSFHSHSYDGHRFARGARKDIAALTGPIYRQDLGRLETRQEYVARIAADIAQARESLASEAGINDKYFCYPYGRYSPELREASRASGYKLAFGLGQGMVTGESDPLLLPRLNVGRPGIGPQDLLAAIQKAARPKSKGFSGWLKARAMNLERRVNSVLPGARGNG
ncbi:MAG: polysaccharide deacetylase family protein [Clostridia bacterium]|nr:MAG: polysaccharide deacetylase family protein [Clostridia bacterium]